MAAKQRSKQLPDWIRERPCAHRGWHDLARGIPENSLAAFEAAVRAGYPIELDVQSLGDGTLVVFHDDGLERATGIARTLRRSTVDDMAPLRLFGTDQHVPFLSEVLALVAGRVPILLELKHHGSNTAIAEALRGALAGYDGPLAIQSFNPYVLRWLRKHAPQYCLGQLGGPLHDDPVAPFERFASRSLLTLALSRPDFVNFDLRGLPDPWVQLVARSAGLPLLAWTVRTQADLAKANALGVNYVFEGVVPAAR
ncbi:MAG: glycerophosphodiester phosphodiesterase family protein [Myxococcales bacterium]